MKNNMHIIYLIFILAVLSILASLFGCASNNTLLSKERDSTKYVVRIETDGGHGTGFPVSKHCFATAAHVVHGDEDTVYVSSPTIKSTKLSVNFQSEEPDVAIICSDLISNMTVKMASSAPKEYSTAYTIGNPLDYSMILTEGKYQGGTTVTTPVAPGNSGGPVFNEDGEVIGLVDEIPVLRQPDQTMIFPHLMTMVPIDAVKSALAKVLKSKDKK